MGKIRFVDSIKSRLSDRRDRKNVCRFTMPCVMERVKVGQRSKCKPMRGGSGVPHMYIVMCDGWGGVEHLC